MIKRILLCLLAGMSLTAMAAPPTSDETSARKIDERMLLKRVPTPKPKNQGNPANPFKAPVRTNPLKALSNSSFYGTVLYSSAWEDYFLEMTDPPKGVYSFSKEADDEATAEFIHTLFTDMVSGYYRENTYGIMTQTISEDGRQIFNDLYEIDTDTWQVARHIEVNDFTYIATDMAYNPADGYVYGTFYNGNASGFNFASFDPETLDYNVIAPLEGDSRYLAIAADNDGNIYAINEMGAFLSVDSETGEETVVGPTGIEIASYLQSMAWDQKSGKLYWVGVKEVDYDIVTSLYVIDPANGIAEEIAPMPASEEVAGMFIPYRESADNAPSQIADLETSFSEGSLIGNVTFTLPATDNVGNALSGELGYVVNINGIDKARGTGNAGEVIKIETTIENGETTISATASNSNGSGPIKRVIFWGGPDTPQAVENLELKNENDKAVLTWELPETGIHGGYVNPETAVYEIVRHPDNVTIAEAHNAKTLTDILQGFDVNLYSYSVTPIYAGLRGETVSSESMLFGETSSVPYFEGFDNEERFEALTMSIDVNNDDNTWSFFSNIWNGYDVESGAANLDYFDEANDDWLIVKPVKLQAGIDYQLTAQMAGGNYSVDFYNSVFEIYLSTSPEIETFSKKLVFNDEFIKIDRFFQQLNSTFSVESDGDYYIAYHGIGLPDEEKDFFYMLIDWVKINEISNFKAPAQISGLALTPGEKGELNATISFTAPTLTYDGSNLNEINGIDIRRDGEIVKSFENVAPGSSLTFNDNGLDEGMTHYSVVARNSFGNGVESADSIFIGHDTPAIVTGVKATDTGKDILLTWNPVNTGVHGGYVDSDALSYIITTPDGITLAEGITGTEWRDAVEMDGEMETHLYNVAAIYNGKTGEAGNAEGIVTGTPLATPFHESFAEGKYQNEGWWGTYDTVAMGEPYQFIPLHNSSADTDREAMAFEAWNYYDSPIGVNATLNTGKISLKDVENPALMFWYFAYTGDNDLSLEVWINDSGKTTEKLWDMVLGPSENTETYRRVEIPLEQYAGHDYVYISFRGRIFDQTWGAMAIDNIQLRNVYDNNLTVDMQLPPNFTTGISNDLPVILHNTGKSPIAAGYNVAVKQNGNTLATMEGPELESDATRVLLMNIKPEVTVGQEFELSAEADYIDDVETDNICTQTVNTVNAELPETSQPVVSNDAEGVKITWQDPDLSGVGPTVEDFEVYNPWQHDAFGQWLSIDVDKEGDVGDSRMMFPEMGEPSSFFVFNPYALDEAFMDYAPEYEPHSGEQYLTNYALDYRYSIYTSNNNDWVVSPRLSGRAQTIELYAKAMEYEPFRVLYSTTGTDINDFTEVAFTEVYGEWEKFEFELPEGARYFAIQSVGRETWVLFIDDITYEGLCDWLEPTGFNVYRDGKLIGTTEPGTCFFVDTQAPDKCTYSVTALYNVGESAPASVDYDRSGIAAIDGLLKIITDKEAIVIRGGEGLKARVYSIDGMLVASATLDGDTRIAATPGVYVVETGDFRTKVIVR